MEPKDNPYLKRVLTLQGAGEIIESAEFRKRDRPRGDYIQLGDLLGFLYTAIEEEFTLSQEEAFAKVQQYFAENDLRISDRHVKDLLIESSPIYYVKRKVSRTSAAEPPLLFSLASNRSRWDRWATPEVRVSRDSLNEVLHDRYGSLTMLTIPQEKVLDVMRSSSLFYTNSSLTDDDLRDEINTLLGEYGTSLDNEVHIPTRMVRLASDLAILRRGLVECLDAHVDLEDISTTYGREVGREIDFSEYVIQSERDVTIMATRLEYGGVDLVPGDILPQELQLAIENGISTKYRVHNADGGFKFYHKIDDVVTMAANSDIELGEFVVLGRYVAQKAA